MDFDKLKTALAALAAAGVEPEKQPAAATAEAPPAKAEVRQNGLIETDYRQRGFHLDVQVAPLQVVEAAELLDRELFFLEAVTGVDWLADQQLEVVYDYKHIEALCRVVVRARLPRALPEVPTVAGIFPGANWHERETHDFFGIIFTGHPDLSPLLLPEDADFHPLLKDFKI